MLRRGWMVMPVLCLALVLGCDAPTPTDGTAMTADSASGDSVATSESDAKIEQSGSAVIVEEGQKAAFFQGWDSRPPFTELVMRDAVTCEEVRKIASLRDLTYLSLTNDACETLPEEFGNLGALKSLHYVLSPGQTSIPNPIFRLRALTSLHIEGDDLRKIPTEITQLRALEELNMGDSPIQEIPDFLGNMPALKQIVLALTEGIEEKAAKFRNKYPDIEVVVP